VNQLLLNTLHPDDVDVVIQRVEEAEVDEMWSYVGKKHEQRWWWHAIDRSCTRWLRTIVTDPS
jgi:insertion element IS1 protein InsB